MDKTKPLRREGVLARQLGDETVLYDSESGNVHIINSMAERVWNMCDGFHSLSDMEKHIREMCEVPQEVAVKSDLQNIIQSFNELGVLAQKDA